MYRCEICKDTGYTGFPVKENACLVQKLLEDIQALNIQELEAENFDTFDPMVPEILWKTAG